MRLNVHQRLIKREFGPVLVDEYTATGYYGCRIPHCGSSIVVPYVHLARADDVFSAMFRHLHQDHGITMEDLVTWNDMLEEHAQDQGGEGAR